MCAVHGDLLPHNVLVQNDGRVFLIDFELAGTGPLYLDLVPMLCVLPYNEAMILVREYHKIRQTVMDADACTAILQQLPALRLARLRGQRSNFRDDEQRFQKMIAWFEYATGRSKTSLH
jgi:thiamine kinase-like enzyme